jgi:hypothetical protein
LAEAKEVLRFRPDPVAIYVDIVARVSFVGLANSRQHLAEPDQIAGRHAAILIDVTGQKAHVDAIQLVQFGPEVSQVRNGHAVEILNVGADRRPLL